MIAGVDFGGGGGQKERKGGGGVGRCGGRFESGRAGEGGEDAAAEKERKRLVGGCAAKEAGRG